MVKLTLTVIVIATYLFQSIVSEIRFVFSFWRHGARAPIEGFDENNLDLLGENWDNPGELTPSGMRMHYLLGVRNSKLWGNFISSTYNSKEVYVKSTDYNRTIMSAQSHLQGLFPVNRGPILNALQKERGIPPVTSTVIDDLKTELGDDPLPNRMQIVPIHIFNPDARSNFAFYNALLCKPLAKIFENNKNFNKNINLVNSINSNWGSLLKQAIKNKNEEWFKDFRNLYIISDTFISDYVDNRPLKSFTDANINVESFLKDAYQLQIQYIFYYYNGDESLWFAKLSMAPIFSDLLRWMETRIKNDIEGIEYTGFAAPKIVLYSTHDTTLGSAQTILADAFKFDKFYLTAFASSFIFELSRPDGLDLSTYTLKVTDYTLKIYYDDAIYKTISYVDFLTAILPYVMTPLEIDNFCKWDEEISDVPTSYIDATIALSCSLFVAVIVLVVLIVLLLRKPKSPNLKYVTSI